MRTHAALVRIICGVSLSASTVRAQDAQAAPAQQSLPERPIAERFFEQRTPEELRELITRRRADLQAQLEALSASERQLDAGKTPREVARQLAQSFPTAPRTRDLVPGAREGAGGDVEQDAQRRPFARQDRPDGLRGREGEGPLPALSREEMLRIIEQDLPALAARLREIGNADEALASQVASRIAPRLRQAVATRARHPELSRARLREIASGFDLLDAIKGVRTAEPASRPAALEAARAALAQNFADKMAVGRLELARIEEEAKRLREGLDDVQAREAALLDAALKDIEEGRMPRPALHPALTGEWQREARPPRSGPPETEGGEGESEGQTPARQRRRPGG